MNFSNLMDQLRVEYLTELPGKIAAIRARFEKSEHEVIQEDFHKLKGTGKTYGIPEISELAAVMEDICIRRPESVKSAVPFALTLLTEIHGRRTAAQVFDITQDERFSTLKRLVS